MTRGAVKLPRVALVALRQRTSEVIREQLLQFVGGRVALDCFSLETGLQPLRGYDLVLVSSVELTADAARCAEPGTDILVARRTIRKDSWVQLMALPAGTRAMLVNDDQESAADTIALIYELGAKHLDLTPVSPYLEHVPNLDMAITPGETQLVPPGVKRVIDIQDRVVDGGTVVDVLTKFGLFDEKANEVVSQYMADTIPRSPGLWAALGRLAEMRSRTELVLNLVQEAVVAFDAAGKVILFNRRAEQMLGQAAWSAMGKPVEDVACGLEVADVLSQQIAVHDVVARIAGKNLVVSKVPLLQDGVVAGGVVTFREVGEIEELEQRLRSELRSKGHSARYTFGDLVGHSPAIRKVIKRALKISAGTSAVLIQGESGTGKEIVAQAIHNASPRRHFPFVAVNCAALPESLLESELFGYEEGAFTGARKGGKAGFFEQAHRGTIFLDEIGDMPFKLQALLLRVLQEKEIVRVGATRVIPVDVRVIAASNQDLGELVRRGAFRPDLYYRLNVLPLRVPPLRERREDILPLAEYYLRARGSALRLSAEVRRALHEYDWPGNVRELENCIEYLVNVAEGDPTLADLSEIIGQSARLGNEAESRHENLEGRAVAVLKAMARAGDRGQRWGRRSLAAAVPGLSEHEVRLVLKSLARAGLVCIGRGRAGTQLTTAGLAAVREEAAGGHR